MLVTDRLTNSSNRLGRLNALRRHIMVRIRQLGAGGVLRLDLRRSLKHLLTFGSTRENSVHPFDLKYGTDTSGVVQPWDLDLPEDRMIHAVQYGTAIVEVFTDILSGLSILYEQFVFVDLGSGKGRALLLASFFPFKEIVGVELSNKMHQTACRNIEIFKDKSQRCGKIRSVCEDAMRFSIPEEKVVFYLFNPFDDEVMRAVLSNIEVSLRELPRTIYIAYLKAAHRHVFDQAIFLHVAQETERYVIYESRSPSSTQGDIKTALRDR